MRRISVFCLFLLLLTGCAVPSLFSATPPPANYVGKSDGFRYYKTQLSPEVQYLYDKLLDGLYAQEEEIVGLYPDTGNLEAAIAAIERDYPELFWFSGTGSIETTLFMQNPTAAVYRPTYLMGREERETAQQQVDRFCTDFLKTVPEGASDYDKIMAVYRYIIDQTDYVDLDSNSILNVIIDGKGLCGCYAKTTQYLLSRLGIDCTTISGEAGGILHAWNLVWPDGVPCWLDTTWGDPQMTDGSKNDGISYDYFCITTADLLKTHKISDTVPVPTCTDESYSYYRRNGLYFDSYHPQAFISPLAAALAEGSDELSLRFSPESYSAALRSLLTNGDYAAVFKRAANQAGITVNPNQKLFYSRNDSMNSIHLIWSR